MYLTSGCVQKPDFPRRLYLIPRSIQAFSNLASWRLVRVRIADRSGSKIELSVLEASSESDPYRTTRGTWPLPTSETIRSMSSLFLGANFLQNATISSVDR